MHLFDQLQVLQLKENLRSSVIKATGYVFKVMITYDTHGWTIEMISCSGWYGHHKPWVN